MMVENNRFSQAVYFDSQSRKSNSSRVDNELEAIGSKNTVYISQEIEQIRGMMNLKQLGQKNRLYFTRNWVNQSNVWKSSCNLTVVSYEMRQPNAAFPPIRYFTRPWKHKIYSYEEVNRSRSTEMIWVSKFRCSTREWFLLLVDKAYVPRVVIKTWLNKFRLIPRAIESTLMSPNNTLLNSKQNSWSSPNKTSFVELLMEVSMHLHRGVLLFLTVLTLFSGVQQPPPLLE